MGLTLTEEQKMLKESAAEFLQTNATIDNFRKLRDNNYESSFHMYPSFELLY